MCPEEQIRKQLQRSQLPTIWKIPDPMWTQLRELLPEEKASGTPGRPPVPFRKVLNGILHVLRTGAHWNAVPGAYGSGSTCHRRFQEWTRAGLFERLVTALLQIYDELRGIESFAVSIGRGRPLTQRRCLRRLEARRPGRTRPIWVSAAPSATS